ncbi:glycosyltransferase [Cytophagaceae bacterium ABcell3]|nr:glycosyltransferase [Cytophagaceae bacterium ABcell3]
MSKDKDLVSIIIPCYNCEAFIEEAVLSCIKQSYDNIEIICVDNNSKDNTKYKIKELQLRYPSKVTTAFESKNGAPAARNKGIELAKGDFVHFLDSDDALFEGAIETLVNNIGDFDGVCGNEYYYQNDFLNKPFKVKKPNINTSDRFVGILDNHPNTSAVLLRAEVFNTIRWEIDLKSGQEKFLWFCIILNQFKFLYVDEDVCKIRVHSSAFRISNQGKKQLVQNTFVMLEKVDEMYSKNLLLSKSRRLALHKHYLIQSYKAICVRNFKYSNMFYEKVDKGLIRTDSEFSYVSREGVSIIFNPYISYFIFKVKEYVVLLKHRMFGYLKL